MTKRARRFRLRVGEPTEDDVLICMRVTIPLLRPENATAPCSDCGATVQVHPTSPNVRRRVCPECAAALVQKGGEVVGARVTREQLAFVRLALWPGGTRQ